MPPHPRPPPSVFNFSESPSLGKVIKIYSLHPFAIREREGGTPNYGLILTRKAADF